jgi:hypothetical protein
MVATISKDLFEAPCEDQNNLKCPHLMDAISGLDSETLQAEENATPQSSDFTRFMSVSTTDKDLLNVATIPAPTVLSHKLLPNSDPDCPQSSSMAPSQSSSGMHNGRGYQWQCKRQSTSSHSTGTPGSSQTMSAMDAEDGPWTVSVAENPHDPWSYTLNVQSMCLINKKITKCFILIASF